MPCNSGKYNKGGKQHMKFAYVIRLAGGSPKSFPLASEIPVTVFDGKDRAYTDEVSFVRPLFANNRREQSNFFQFVEELEKSPVESMQVRIDIDSVILNYRTAKAKRFSRNPYPNRLDFD